MKAAYDFYTANKSKTGKTDLAAARTAYDTLTDAAKAYVPNGKWDTYSYSVDFDASNMKIVIKDIDLDAAVTALHGYKEFKWVKAEGASVSADVTDAGVISASSTKPTAATAIDVTFNLQIKKDGEFAAAGNDLTTIKSITITAAVAQDEGSDPATYSITGFAKSYIIS